MYPDDWAFLPSLGVGDETSGFAGTSGIGIERAGLAESDRNDASHNILDSGLPLGRVGGLRLIEDREVVVLQLASLVVHEPRELNVGCVLAGRAFTATIQAMPELLLQGSLVGGRGGLPFRPR